jgi:hypothetical protein
MKATELQIGRKFYTLSYESDAIDEHVIFSIKLKNTDVLHYKDLEDLTIEDYEVFDETGWLYDDLSFDPKELILKQEVSLRAGIENYQLELTNLLELKKNLEK